MDAETATVLRGRAKAALTRTINFIDKNDQTFDKNDIRNKLEKLELTYTKFDKADAALPIESSEMEEFETKYYETKAKLQNILENLSVRTYVYNENVTYEKQPYINKSKFNNSLKCSCCKMNNLVFKCSKFKEMSVKERIQLVNKQKLCMNCLSDRHTESHCNSTLICHYCKKKHHSLLHDNNFKNFAMSANKSHRAEGQNQTGNDTNQSKEVAASVNSIQTCFSLSPTLSVKIDLVSLHDPKVKLPVKAYVLEKLTTPLPTEKINETHFSHLKMPA
ncbi:hypothetical protein TNCV_2143021 [Trichonephila clavipes]|nr:hypothetical protein TNCV_2143021 [Trichonephila clavipes]